MMNTIQKAPASTVHNNERSCIFIDTLNYTTKVEHNKGRGVGNHSLISMPRETTISGY